MRFANRLFEPVWSNEHIERVDIVFDEQLTLENRARYYDHAGALMDMIQSHLLQVLALAAMEPIARADAVDLRDRTGSLGAGRQHVTANQVRPETGRGPEERVALRHRCDA